MCMCAADVSLCESVGVFTARKTLCVCVCVARVRSCEFAWHVRGGHRNLVQIEVRKEWPKNILKIYFVLVSLIWGPRWRSWLRHCATSQKVAGSIPDVVIGIFH